MHVNTPKFIIVSFALLLVAACQIMSDKSSAAVLSPLWIQGQGFVSPESAIFDEKRQHIIVSNVNGYTKNQLGFLSRLSLQGELLDQPWIRGLNGPTGMAIWRDTLFVADIDRLVAIDLQREQIRAEYPAPDENPGLNDVTVSAKGEVFVTGSASQAIYRLQDNKLTTWAKDDQLKYANGIYAAKDKLWVAGYYLRWLNYADQSIHNPGLDEELVDLESVESDGKDGLIITKIGPGPIYHLSSQGELTEIIERETYSADVEFITSTKQLIVPSDKNRVFAFTLALH